ncbi:MAG: hypothetical protein ACI4XL_04440 [Bacillus sp. (in: firmicutes)]
MNNFTSLYADSDSDATAITAPTLLDRLLASPLQMGIWSGGKIIWTYPSEQDQSRPSELQLQVTSMNSTQEYEMIKFQLRNIADRPIEAKVVIRYHNVFVKSTTAFYSPNENAIICFSRGKVTVLGGLLDNCGMRQYTIQDRHIYGQARLEEDLSKGHLPMKWLGQGDLSGIFTLEMSMSAGQLAEGSIWTFHSNSEEAVHDLKNHTLSNLF